MVPPHERPRLRWSLMAAGWVLVATLLLLHTLAVRDYLALLDTQGLRGAPAATTPLRHTLPLVYADAQMWVLHALDLPERGATRARFTTADNAPFGREVHWSSPLVWLLAGAGQVRAAVTGEPLPLATERTLPWTNFGLLLSATVALSAWTARRAGAAAGLLIALGMLGHRDFYDGFSPYYVDHHGPITTSIFGLVLGTVFMGGGWWRAPATEETSTLLPASAIAVRQAAIISALFGAVGLWISAASIIPALALVALACLINIFFLGRPALVSGTQFSAAAWRLWGRVGAGASVFFYLVEYAPAHLGLRMEVNHPLYALAWWGAAELLAALAEWRLALPATPRVSMTRRWLLPALAVAAAPLVILFGGVTVFAVRDPIISALLRHVLEGMSLPALVQATGWDVFFLHVNESLLPVLPAVALLFVRDVSVRLVISFTLCASLGFLALACNQVRFWQSTSGPQLCLALVTLAALSRGRSHRLRTALIVVTAAGLFLPNAVNRVVAVRGALQARTASPLDLAPALHRDLAAALRASQPTGDIVLLACPTTAGGIAYYGRFQTVGTLYWENHAGLRAAAEIFCATSEAEARARMRARGVTHLVLSTGEDFLRNFFTLLHPTAPPADFERTFGYGLWVKQNLPLWLRLMPYAPPADLQHPGLRVFALQVVPDQTEPEALHHIAVAQLLNGLPAAAEATWLAALEKSPPAARASFALTAGNLCYQHAARPAAARLYRGGLAAGGDFTLAVNLAWQLATDPDATVRHAADALALAQGCLAARPDDFTAQHALAAALAENGRLPEAVASAQRALALARAAGQTATLPLLERTLAAYTAGQPWRQ